MVAFSANKLVCSAIPVIVSTISPIFFATIAHYMFAGGSRPGSGLLYASLGFIMVTREGTDWPLWIFWAGLVLAVVSLAGYLRKARREVRT